jgi:RHS repeat-associated protein
MKVVGAVTTVFVYNILGQLIAEYQTPDQPVVGEGGTSYLTTDHLGSTRVVTNAQGQVKARYDYLAYGEEIPSGVGGRTAGMGYGGADATRQKFTQKERDSESGLDYFLARYYSSTQGRFTSIDPHNIVIETHYAHDEQQAREQFISYLSNPQRWNRYPYALNNALLYTDPDGKDVTIYYRPSDKGKDAGHIFIYVRNDETGESAYFDYLPNDDLGVSILNNVRQSRIDETASLTIRTNAEQEQAILNGIKELQKSTPDWHLLGGPNCVTKSSELLKLGGIEISGPRPIDFWGDAFKQFSKEAKWRRRHPEEARMKDLAVAGQGWPEEFSWGFALKFPKKGTDYGRDPRAHARKVDLKASNPYLKFRGGKIVPE